MFNPKLPFISFQRDKVQTLTNDISETRTGVTDVKCFIDGMRTSRDTKMKDMADLKAKLKDQNQRLIQVTQDKARVSSLFICLEITSYRINISYRLFRFTKCFYSF